jgi:hypothetical protein
MNYRKYYNKSEEDKKDTQRSTGYEEEVVNEDKKPATSQNIN